jgi:hypothetical protein
LPEASTPEQHFDGVRDPREWGSKHGRAHDENQVPAWGDMTVDQTNGFTDATLGAVTIMRLSNLLSYDKAAAHPSNTITRRIEHQQWMGPRLPSAANTPELLGAAEPAVSLHYT